MSTEREEHRALSERFDARLLSLYSRGVQDGMPRGLMGADRSYSFCYYDLIEVKKVEIGNGPVLKDAYMLAQKERYGRREVGLGFGHSLVAVMDISDGAKDAFGYTQDDISGFWSPEREFPLFFVSMLNLADTKDLEAALKEIKKIFCDMPHLAYITFDHCDIILFCRGDSFREYARRIFKLYYAGEKGLGDAITLYSFTGCSQLPETEERFAALVRVGVEDYPSREQFYKKLEVFEKEEEYDKPRKYWLLERNDIGFYREDATLSWLIQVRQAVLDVEREHGAPWYTTYSLTVLIPDGTDDDSGIWREYDRPRENQVAANLQERMNALYKEFKEKYEKAHARLREKKVQVYCDQVLLRWLEESYCLVVSLTSSRLSEDLGVCLLPQFIDMLEYGNRLFSQTDNILLTDLEHIQKSFDDFFSSIAVLVDSMNQTDRKFVQVPAFHLPSFEIPPQVMAYYTIIVRKMLTALRDDDREVFYGFTIAPKLVNTLSVVSLSIPEILPNDEWISMNMDEISFYTLRLTTETIAHEVSHYIGERLRKRKTRKGCMLKCTFQILLSELARRFAERVDSLAGLAYGESQKANKLHLRFCYLNRAAEILWGQVQELDPEWYGSDTCNYSWQMESVIWQIPRDINDDLAFGTSVIEQTWQVIQGANDENRKVLMERLRYYVKWKLGMQADCLSGGAADTLDVIVRSEADDIFATIIDELVGELRCAPNQPSAESEGAVQVQLDYLCYMFRETFADLQAILLLKMTWEDYCSLLLQGNERPGADHTPRMFAVTKALLNCNEWSTDSIRNGDVFANVRNALNLDFINDNDVECLANVHRISPALSSYLIEYLTDCAKDIQKFFSDERSEVVGELQKIHEDISDQTSFLARQKMILGLTEEYWQNFLQ